MVSLPQSQWQKCRNIVGTHSSGNCPGLSPGSLLILRGGTVAAANICRSREKCKRILHFRGATIYAAQPNICQKPREMQKNFALPRRNNICGAAEYMPEAERNAKEFCISEAQQYIKNNHWFRVPLTVSQSPTVPVSDDKEAPMRNTVRLSALYGLAYPFSFIWARASSAVPSSLNSKM